MFVSAIILTKNEEENIIDCIAGLSFVQEIIIVDDYSEDKTIELVERSKDKRIKIFRNKLKNDFSKQRNFALQQAQGEWVLFLDADERVPESLAYEISNVSISAEIVNKYQGFYVKRRDFIWSKELKYGETGNIKLLRLAKKNAGNWEGKVHEEWKIKGQVSELKNPILHYPHKNLNEFLKEINFYTDLRAKELFEKGTRSNFVSIIAYPKAKFFLNYIFKKGFKDGIPGLIFAILMSFHSFMVRAKLWTMQDKQ